VAGPVVADFNAVAVVGIFAVPVPAAIHAGVCAAHVVHVAVCVNTALVAGVIVAAHLARVAVLVLAAFAALVFAPGASLDALRVGFVVLAAEEHDGCEQEKSDSDGHILPPGFTQ
jgi:hypothetical protein